MRLLRYLVWYSFIIFLNLINLKSVNGQSITGCPINASQPVLRGNTNAGNVPILCMDVNGNLFFPIGSINNLSNTFNIKNYGAFGDTQSVTSGFTWNSAGSGSVTCTSCKFTPANIGATIYVSGVGNGMVFNGIIASVSSSGVANLSNQGGTGIGPLSKLIWGHLDDNAASLVGNAASNNAVSFQDSQAFNRLGPNGSATNIYLPAGGYMFCGTNAVPAIFTPTVANASYYRIYGDGVGQTIIFPCPVPPVPGFGSVWFAGLSGLVDFSNFSIDGGYIDFGNRYIGLISIGGNNGFDAKMDNITISHGGNSAGFNFPALNVGTSTKIKNINLAGNILGMNAAGNDITIESSTLSNNITNLQITNVPAGGIGGGGAGFRWIGGLLDECNATDACEKIVNSVDVYFIGVSAFSATGTATATAFLNDGTSQLHLTDVVCGQFSGGGCFKNNNGGLVTLSDVRMFPGAGAFCYTNNGLIKNMGGNVCQVGATIAASPTGATESGTTVTITTTTAHGYHQSDIVWIKDVPVTGYNGNYIIQSVPSNTTFTYTSQTSGLAASGTGTTVGPAGINTTFLVGAPPIGTITHSNWNAFVSSLSATSTFAQFTIDQPVTITRLQSNILTAPVGCTTNAVLQLTDGTTPINLTITALTNDSGIISQAYPGGTVLQLKISTAAAGCTTFPLNLNGSMLWQAGLTP